MKSASNRTRSEGNEEQEIAQFSWIVENEIAVGLNYHPLEVRDTDSLQVWPMKLDLAIGIINDAHEKKEPVYLHCTYGKGRSPTFAMAYLISQGHLIQEAMQLVCSKHPDVWSPGNPTSKYTEILEAYTKRSGR